MSERTTEPPALGKSRHQRAGTFDDKSAHGQFEAAILKPTPYNDTQERTLPLNLFDPNRLGGARMPVNLVFGWIWILAGFISGAVVGVHFYNPDYLGGFGSWRRRMVRLGHISFLGTGLLNLAFALTVAMLEISSPSQFASWLFLAGALSMPLVCFLSAWRDRFRYLFPVPVGCLIGGSLFLIAQVLR